MYALPCLVVDVSGNYKFYLGSLFNIPPDLRSPGRLLSIAKQAKAGWSLDDLGYDTYCAEEDTKTKLIFFGLVTSHSRIKRKIPGYSQSFSRDAIETFTRELITRSDSDKAKGLIETNDLIHDLRSLSTTIYHSANEASIFLNQRQYEEVEKRIRNIAAAQGLLKIRTDAYDFLTNSNALRGQREIAVFRRVDKVTRFLMSTAADSGKFITLGGQSYNTVFGPDLFELIPYTVIENAVKYPPIGATVSVEVHDESGTRIMVTSLGPRIARQEQEAIFGRGYRGSEAVASGVPGSGLGLHVARRIVVEVFGGDLRVQQSPSANFINDYIYHDTTFTILLPSRP